MNKNFFCENIKKNPFLFSAILNFNVQNIHNDIPYSSDLQQSLDIDFFSTSSFKKYQKNPYLFFWNFTDETKRIALLDIETLQELSLILGLSIHAEEIAQNIHKNFVLQLQKEIGKKHYLYTIERGKYRLGSIKKTFQEKDTNLPIIEKIQKHGQEMLFLNTSTWEKQLKNIFTQQIKNDLPYLFSFLSTDNTIDISQEQKRLVWFSIKKLLTQEVNAKWLPLFK